MREKEVKKLIGKENWKGFCKWMGGQTVGIYPDGEADYYDCDVEAYLRKLKTGYDRQEDPDLWD